MSVPLQIRIERVPCRVSEGSARPLRRRHVCQPLHCTALGIPPCPQRFDHRGDCLLVLDDHAILAPEREAGGDSRHRRGRRGRLLNGGGRAPNGSVTASGRTRPSGTLCWTTTPRNRAALVSAVISTTANGADRSGRREAGAAGRAGAGAVSLWLRRASSRTSEFRLPCS